MHFDVNGTIYFLNFNPSEERWMLLTPSADGVESVQVFDDGAPVFENMVIDFEPGDHRILN